MPINDYQDPTDECDLVMKGGIASGVVYPPAILELAMVYRLRGIGGASAGAIAAATAAAAEYGRHVTLEGAGFRGLQALSTELGSGKFIPSLLQPSRESRSLYCLLTALMHNPTTPGAKQRSRAARLTCALVRHAPLGCFGGLLVGLLCFAATRPDLVVASFAQARTGLGVLMAGLHGVTSLGLLVLFLGGGALLGSALALKPGFDAVRSAKSLYGFCTGSRGEGAGDMQLTDWLHARINALAGIPIDGRPLTIGDLAAGSVKASDGRPPTPGAPARNPSIKFRMVTTNLSHARPYIFPQEKRDLIFHEDDMRRLFPKVIVDYLIKYKQEVAADAAVAARWKAEAKNQARLPKGYYYLPAGGDLPVVVATRLSLSFPLLLSAVRLFTVEGPPQAAKATHDPNGSPATLQENWFSDGGIAANFPLSMFDRWLPSRPTFGINLGDGPVPSRVKVRTDADGVFRHGARETYESMPQPGPIEGLTDLFLAMLETARSARDNAQMGLASYRERVVHIYLKPHEGGLNLEMSDETISAIQAKGVKAAHAFLGKGGAKPFDFVEHRWVRLRLLMAHLEDELFAIRDLATDAEPLRDQVKKLLDMQLENRKLARRLRWYRTRPALWCREAEKRIDALIRLIEAWETAQAARRARSSTSTHFFHDPATAPKPAGALRVTSEI